MSARWNPAGVTELFAELGDDERGQAIGLAVRRAVMTLFAAIAVLGLWGLFGQRASESSATGAAAAMRLTAPATVRGGLFFQARLDIRARQAIEHPRIVLDEGWVEGLQANSIEPAAESESSRDGRVVLSYGAVEAGASLVVWLQFEVNPTNVGRRSFAVELDDSETPIARVDRDLTVLP